MPAAPSKSRTRAASKRRPHHRLARRRSLSWRARLAAIAMVSGCAAIGWAIVARWLAPTGNTAQSSFDAVVVLGAHVDADGNPTPALLARTTEGVREYQRGVAPRLIFTGGADHEQFVEARVMRKIAEAQGVPDSAILIEPDALDTIHNACYASRILKAHGWTSAEVVTSPSHLPRAGIVFSHTPIAWRMHVAPPIERPSGLAVAFAQSLETLKTIRYLLYAKWSERCSP